MNVQLVEKIGKSYLECLPDEWRLSSEQDALDLVAACGEYGTQNLMLHAESLPEAFYNLKTRLAGEVMLKFSNYRLVVAAVIPAELSGRGRFGEMALETNRGSQFRVFATREEAENWLTK